MVNSKKFIKKKENFTCAQCGVFVEGNGYTNHCPQCLWSKHVDIHPGDRKSLCGGMMRPEQIEIQSGEYSIVHKCVICKHSKRNKTSPNDNFEVILSFFSQKKNIDHKYVVYVF